MSVHPEWLAALSDVMRSSGYAALRERVERDRLAGPVYPHAHLVGRALWRPPGEARVVILGQDPYHGKDHRNGLSQASGLAFSVGEGVSPPPSLRVILAELRRDLVGDEMPQEPARTRWAHARHALWDGVSGDLSPWAAKGVVLLNTALTVCEGEPGSHAAVWHGFTRAVISHLASQPRPLVWMLWGSHARRAFFTALPHKPQHSNGLGAARLPAGFGEWLVEWPGRPPHLVLTAPHPSPLAARSGAPFAGCGHFSRCNAWLATQGADSVDWALNKPKDHA